MQCTHQGRRETRNKRDGISYGQLPKTEEEEEVVVAIEESRATAMEEDGRMMNISVGSHVSSMARYPLKVYLGWT